MTLNVLIVEDEKIAMENLSRILRTHFPEIRIIGNTASIKETVCWLNGHPGSADVIFMDVELSDGNCFEIFRQTKVDAKVIMTTAYDSYAIKAFEAGSIDYLLKPVDQDALKRAIDRCRKSASGIDLERLSRIFGPAAEYRQRFIVRINDKILPVRTDDIAYFYSEEKNTVMETFDGRKYIIDSTLDVLTDELEPMKFFRISRGCILNMQAIESLVKHLGNRLRVIANPRPDFDMTVSRGRADEFMKWIENGK